MASPYYILPPDLQRSLASLEVPVESMGFSTSHYFPYIIPDTAVFAVFSVLILLSTYFSLRNGMTPWPRVLMWLACIVMYAMATLHWALIVHSLVANMKVSAAMRDSTMQCISDLINGNECSPAFTNPSWTFVNVSPCSTTATLLVNITLSDAIVLWRTFIMSSKNRVVQVISGALVISTLTTASLSARTSCRDASKTCFIDDNNGFAAFILSWATNAWATAVVFHNAWKYRRQIQNELRVSPTAGLRTGKIFILLIDSGLIYCALWTLLLVADIAMVRFGLGGQRTSTTSWQFMTGMNDGILGSTLIQIIGIYPTILVTMAALARSHYERTFINISLTDLSSGQTDSGSTPLRHGVDVHSGSPGTITPFSHLRSDSSSSLGVTIGQDEPTKAGVDHPFDEKRGPECV